MLVEKNIEKDLIHHSKGDGLGKEAKDTKKELTHYSKGDWLKEEATGI